MRVLKNLFLIGIIGFLASACTMPEYQMAFDITNSPVTSGSGANKYVSVDYLMTNVGDKKLYNAMIKIRVQSDTSVYYQDWTPGRDINTGSSVTGTMTFSLGSGNYVTNSAVIVGSGWDDNSKN